MPAAFTLTAADWPQYRGANHDGISSDRINKNWSGGVTNPIWRLPVTNSLSSFTVSGERAFTQVNRFVANTNKEVCIALSITNGAELWATPVEDAWYPDGGVGYDDGPRSTPTYDNGSLYVLTSYRKFLKLNATNGVPIWTINLATTYGGTNIQYQNSASPLIENGLIYVNANCYSNTLLALSTTNGSLVWRSQNEATTHSTPVITTIQGVRQVLFATQSGVVSLNPLTGALLWKFTYPFTYSGHSLAVSPVVYQDMVFMSGAHTYGYGSVVRRVTFTNNAWSTSLLWWTNNVASHYMTPVVFDGFIYGQFGYQQTDLNYTTPLKCVDMRTGAVKWSTNNFGHGGVLLANNNLLLITERGDLVLAQPNINAYTELARFTAIPEFDPDTNKCWNTPAVANGRVYVRSTSWGACFDLSVPNLKLDAPQVTNPAKFQLTVRTIDGTAIDPNRLTTMEIHASASLAQPPAAWPKVTNSLTLSNGVATVTNIDGSVSPTRFFIISEPN